MPSGAEGEKSRMEKVVDFYRKSGANDPAVLDLFTDDAQFHFPKLGVVQGKAAFVEFRKRMGGYLAELTFLTDEFNYIEGENHVVVEGKERGMTHSGVHWPDGVISQGRFCSVFEFDGPLIRRMFVYVDPDFTSEDVERIRVIRGTD